MVVLHLMYTRHFASYDGRSLSAWLRRSCHSRFQQKTQGGCHIVCKENVHLMSLEDLPQVLKVREVAAILRISLSQAYELVAQGTIPSVRLGKVIRVPRAALEQYLCAQADLLHAEAHIKDSRTTRKAG